MTLGYEVLYVETGINRGEQESDNICTRKPLACKQSKALTLLQQHVEMRDALKKRNRASVFNSNIHDKPLPIYKFLDLAPLLIIYQMAKASLPEYCGAHN